MTWCTSGKFPSTRGSIRRQRLAVSMRGARSPNPRHFHLSPRVGQQLLGHPEIHLDLFGILGGRAQRHRDVAGDHPPAMGSPRYGASSRR